MSELSKKMDEIDEVCNISTVEHLYRKVEQLQQELKEAKDDLKTAEDTINELTIQIIGGE